jgi:hypothetical protein
MRARTTLIATGAAIAGVIVGTLVTAWFMSRSRISSLAAGAVATVAVDGRALQYLHDGDPDAAAALLQARIDGELVMIGWDVKGGYYALSPDAKKAFSRIKRLRDSTGYESSDPGVRKAVSEALAAAGSNQ